MKKKGLLLFLVTLLVLAFAMPVSAASFSDVKDSDWFAPFVYDLSDQNILSGYPDGTFRPQNTVTRGEFVKILAFASKDDLSGYGKNLPFIDSQNHWSKANIDWAYQNGIVNGKSATSFDPDGKITRQEMAVMIYRYADYKNIALPKKADPIAFRDSNDIASWAKDAVSAMQQSQIISGYPDKTFKPTNNANRGEAAKMISVYIDLSRSEEEKREAFLAKDVDDFDADKVINFDNSKTENFGVVLDEVEIIEDDKKINQVLSKNEETGVYVFENINDELKSLKPGDKFVIPGSDPENSVAIVVETISINGTTATIKSKGGEIGDFYQYIQIDMEMEPEAGHIEVVNSDFSYAGSETLSDGFQPLSEDGVTPSLKVKDTFKVEHSFNANIHSSNLEVGGTIELSLKVKPVVEYDFELFGKDYIRFDMTTEISNTNKVSIEIKEKPESEFGEIYKDEIIEIDIPVATGVNVVGGIDFIINADGKISAEFESESKKTSGFKFNTKDGYREIDESESKDSSFKLGMEGKLEAGVEAKFGVEIIEIVEASLNTGVGAGVKLSASIVDTSKVHNCYLCLDGNAYRFVEAKFKVELGVGKSKITPVNVTLTRAEHEFGKCYCSLLNENGELKFGWGECPNKKEKTEDEILASGTWGGIWYEEEDDTITWTVDSDYTLTFSGTGYLYGGASVDSGLDWGVPWWEWSDKIKKVVIESGITGVGACLFGGMNIDTVDLPDTIIEIEQTAFDYWGDDRQTKKILNVNVDKDNPVYKSVNGVVLSKDGKTLVYVPYGRTGNYIVPNGVEEIARRSFYISCLDSVTISNGVITIREEAFDYSNISSVSLPSSLKEIEGLAFLGTNLKNIDLPSGIEKIGYAAFSGTEISSIFIPSSVQTISPEMFRGMYCLKNISVDSQDPNYKTVEGVLFSKDGKELICCPEGITGTYVIPKGVETIKEDAFYYHSISGVVIPKSVVHIEMYAFGYGGSSLESVYYEGSEEDRRNNGFFSIEGVNFALDDATWYYNYKYN